MALKFWLGGADSDKSRKMIKYILDEADEHPDRQYLVIVPEQFGLAMQRELVLNSKNCGILNIDVLSFTRLAHRINDEVGSYESDITMLDETGKSLLIQMLAQQMRSSLKVFGNDLDKPGYIDKIKSLISEYMQYGITVDKAMELSGAAAVAGRGLLADKLGDVASVYNAFKEYIKDRYTTVEETLDRVSHLIPKSETIKNSVVAFDGFTGFTPIQNKLIGVLMDHAISVEVALLYEDCIQKNEDRGQIREHELFYLSKKTMDQLGRMADERHIIIEDPYKAHKSVINNTQGKIVYNNGISARELNNTNAHILSGQDPYEEIRLVISKMIGLIRNDGYHYKDMAVLVGDMESYRHVIEREFDKHGIPFFIDRTEPVLLNPFIEYIRSFIGIISDNYSIPSVFRFLKSGLTGFDDSKICELENYCLAANIKGFKKWHERFDRHTQTVSADELPDLNDIRERFIAKCDLFTKELADGGKVNAGSVFTVTAFAKALYALIISDGIEEKLKEAAKEFENAGNRKLAGQYGRIYAKIMDMLDELCDLIPEEKTDIRGFKNLLDAGLNNIRIGTAPSGMDYVQIGDLTRSRLNDVKALFIAGANDGIIPRVGRSGGIINESEREFLLRADDKLILAPTAKEDVYTQQLYIYMAASRPSEHLFVSFSRTSPGGDSLLPSYIVRKIRSCDSSIKIETAPEYASGYTDEEDAFEGLINDLYPAVAGALPSDRSERVKELTAYFLNNDAYGERLKKILMTGILRAGADSDDSIGSAVAHAIYGSRITASITRLENYAKCAYRYFLEYGVKLREREVFSLEARDVGNIFHDSVKEYSRLMTDGGQSWADIEDEERDRLMDKAVDTVMERYRSDKLAASARYSYMENRIRRIMRSTADIVCAQVRRGVFVPKYFEVDFDRMDSSEDLSIKLNDEDVMNLRGRIDRVDTYEKDDTVYIRIIDYKSSHHDINLAAVYEGRQLQLLVYLNAAMNMEKGLNDRKGTYVSLIPAGVLYYHMDDPIIEAKGVMTEDDIHDLIMKKLRLSGLVNSDVSVLKMMDKDIGSDSYVLPASLTAKGEARRSKQTVSEEDLKVMSEYVTKKIRSMGREMISGNIAVPVPDNGKRFTGPDCGFCPYTSICANRRHPAGPQDGTVRLSEISNEEWISRMKSEDEG